MVKPKLDSKKITAKNTDDIFWTSAGLFDLYGFNGDNAFDSSGIVNPALRRNVWRVKIIDDGVDQLVTLIPDVAVGNEQKVYVKSGNKNGEQSYYKPSSRGSPPRISISVVNRAVFTGSSIFE